MPLALHPRAPQDNPNEQTHHQPRLRNLTATQLRLLDELTYLARLQARRSPSGAKYCTPGRHYLARKCGRSIWTISRNLHDPRLRGIIITTQRRPTHGRWHTNLYRVTSWRAWAWSSALHHAISTTPHRPTAPPATGSGRDHARAPAPPPRAPNRTQSSPVGESITAPRAVPPALQAVLSRIQAKLQRND